MGPTLPRLARCRIGGAARPGPSKLNSSAAQWSAVECRKDSGARSADWPSRCPEAEAPGATP